MKRCGFTLAELLIALAILGVIATFTIPKVLQSQTDQRNISVIKEAVAMVSGAFSQYKYQNTLNTGVGIQSLTQYMNYVRYDTSGASVDHYQNSGTISVACTNAQPCLRLHSGATLYYWETRSFGNSNPTNAVWFEVDPDGKVTDGTSTGPGRAVEFWLYYNGRVTTIAHIDSNTCDSAGCIGPNPSADPPWFSW